jgi:replication factor A1
LISVQGGEIRATMFNACVDKYDPVLEVGKVFLCSNMQVKPANKQYNGGKHDYELTINESSVIVPVDDDATIAAITV